MSTDLVQTIVTLSQMLATSTATITRLEAELKAAENRPRVPDETVEWHNTLLKNNEELRVAMEVDARGFTAIINKLECEQRSLNGEITQLKADLKEAKLPKKGTLPMTKNPNRTYMEGVAYQVRTLAYRTKHKELPVATLKVFRDDAHAKAFLKEGYASTGGKGAPVRLGAALIECETPVTPEIYVRNKK